MNARTIGPRLRQIRKAKGMTQETLGALVGLEGRSGTVTVSRWEKGTIAPTLARLFDIAEALGVEPLELLRRVSVDGSL